MFEIVSVFTRPDAEVDFFYLVQANHPVLKSLRENYINALGARDIIFKHQDSDRIEISMTFESDKDFWNFVKDNQKLLDQRKELIDDWCSRTGHSYSFYTISN